MRPGGGDGMDPDVVLHGRNRDRRSPRTAGATAARRGSALGGAARIVLVLAFAWAAFGAIVGASAAVAADWPSAGHDLADSRTQPDEFVLNRFDVSRLAPKWVFTTHGDVSATPTVSDGAVYFPDWGGYLNAVNARNGSLLWQSPVSAYTGVSGDVARNSPAVDGNELILGDNDGYGRAGGARVFAVDRASGRPLWNVVVDSDPAAIITANPVVYGDEVIVGVSSNSEYDAILPTFHCCTFRGSLVALQASTGRILWQTYMVPPNSGPCTTASPAGGCGYTGGAIWGNPVIDPLTNSVFVATGNNYTTPDAAAACEQTAVATGVSDANCTAPDDFFDSVVSLNLFTGRINWGHKLEGWDVWNFACVFGAAVSWCPSIEGPDDDFGGSLNLLQTGDRTLIGAGQKSGVYWALDARTGALVWDTLVGAGGGEGGIQWGTAFDGRRIYVPISDADGVPYTLTSGQTDDAGSWSALDPATGRILWQVADPSGAADLAPASEANGVVYVGSAATQGNNMYALDAASGKTLWSFAAPGPIYSGPSIVDGTVYWGSGYYDGPPSTKFYAFSLGGH